MHPLGVDLAKEGGCWINAIADGEVTLVSTLLLTPNEGFVVTIDHGSYKSTYWHGAEQSSLKKDDDVKAGDLILKMGAAGNSIGVHLHIGIKPLNADKFLNPESEDLLRKLSPNGVLFQFTRKY